MTKIELFTINRCPKCAVLKQLLDTTKLGYELSFDTEKMAAMGITTAPMLSVDGELMNYIKAIEWVRSNTI